MILHLAQTEDERAEQRREDIAAVRDAIQSLIRLASKRLPNESPEDAMHRDLCLQALDDADHEAGEIDHD